MLVNPKKVSKVLFEYQVTILFAFVVALVLGEMLWLNFGAECLIGIDGYYYVVQISAIETSSNLYFPSYSPLVIYVVTALNSLIQNSVYSIRITSVIFQVLLYLGVWLVVNEITSKKWLAFVSVAICFLSGLHRYLMIEYLSQLGGITFTTWSLWSLLKFRASGKFKWIVIGSLLMLLGSFSHRSILPLILVAAWSYLLWRALVLATKGGCRFLNLLAGFGVAATILLPCILAFVASHSSFGIDVRNNFTFVPQLPFRLSTFSEIALLFIAAPACLWMLLKREVKDSRSNSDWVLGMLSIFSIVLTLNPFMSSELGFSSLGGRLRVLSFIQVAILVPSAFQLIRDSFPKFNAQRALWLLFGVVVFALIIMSFSLPLPRGAQKDFVDNRTDLIHALEQSQNLPNRESLIIANHGQQFVVTAITGIRSQQKFPREPDGMEIFWLLEGVAPTLVDDAMYVLFRDSLGRCTVLVKHDERWKIRLLNPSFTEPIRMNNRHVDVYLADQIANQP